LYLLKKILIKSDKSLANYPPMPLAPEGPAQGEKWEDTQQNYILAEQLDYDVEQQKAVVQHNLERFNPEQQDAFESAISSVTEKLGNMVFIHSTGGCGKTLVCNTIAAAVRSQGKIALCIASSGIAALLEGGRTAHSRFRIPLDINETLVANIDHQSFMLPVLKQTEVIIWDEVPMQHKYAIDSVDRAVRDLLKNDKPFGGITAVFGGDFRQTLPVVP
jgi:PIF1-like helicase